jgi:tRNA dimethylallyltransferase
MREIGIHNSAARLPAIIISGPTAAGKSELAIKLALRLGGEIVNCDSVQVYRSCNIGSAKPSEIERQSVPHHLFDIFEPNEQCDATRYRELALGAIEEIQGRGKVPILVGSSGLYISTLLEGIDSMPGSCAEVRALLNEWTTESLYQELSRVDFLRAQVLHPSDRGRIVRALEVWQVSGVPQSTWFKQNDVDDNRVRELPAVILVMVPDRDVIYARINERSRQMVNGGLIEETSSIIEEYGSSIAPMYAIGYRETKEFLALGGGGVVDRELLTERIALVTRRYSKRQRTYWRNEPEKRGWEPFVSLLNGKEAILEQPWINILSERCRGVGNKVEVWYLYESLVGESCE